MTNLNPIIVGLSMVGIFAAILGGIFYRIGEKKKAAHAALLAARAAAPITWVSTGLTPPVGWETALDVIRKAYSALPPFGTIEWVTGPYVLDGFGKVAGHVQSFDPPHVKVMRTEKVEQGAFAHEMLHIDDFYRFGAAVCPRESPGDKAFVAQFTAVNADIAKALGR